MFGIIMLVYGSIWDFYVREDYVRDCFVREKFMAPLRHLHLNAFTAD
jgi:hypothetical protein